MKDLKKFSFKISIGRNIMCKGENKTREKKRKTQIFGFTISAKYTP